MADNQPDIQPITNPDHPEPAPKSNLRQAMARGYEHDHMRLKPIVVAAGVLVAIAAVLHVVLWWFWSDFNKTQRTSWEAPSAVAAQRPLNSVVAMDSAPLQGTERHAAWPYEDVVAMNKSNAEHLAGSGKRPDGTSYIPIERAMQLTIERGLLKAATQPAGGKP